MLFFVLLSPPTEVSRQQRARSYPETWAVTVGNAFKTAGRRQGQLDEIAEALGDRLDTRVRIALGANKGTVTIEFATVADLNRILGELGQPGFQ